MEKINGILKKLIFFNDENNYFVAFFSSKEKNFLGVGNFFPLEKNSNYLLTGTWVKHQKYGEQFQVTTMEKVIQKSLLGVIDYISNHVLVDIPKSQLKKIINKSNEKTWKEVLFNDGDIASLNIAKKYQKIIKTKLEIDKNLNKVNRLLIETTLDKKALGVLTYQYKNDYKLIYETLKIDPYSLITIPGISINILDSIVAFFKNRSWHEKRIIAIFYQNLKHYFFETGNTLIKKDELQKLPWAIKFDLLTSQWSIENNFFEILDNSITTKEFYIFEKFVFKKMQKICAQTISLYKESNNKNLDYTQNEIVTYCIQNSLTIILGGPGTGKTTLINEIFNNLKNKEKTKKIKILAPTGKSSQRIKEFLNDEDKKNVATIHSYLGWIPEQNRFHYNEINPRKEEIILIDEFSMVSLPLFYFLLKALPNLKQIIILGDRNQLPSIDSGEMLNDFAMLFPNSIKKLFKNYRQKGGAEIANLAKLVESQDKEILNTTYKKVNFIENNITQEAIKETFFTMVSKFSIENVQILTPIKHGMFGTKMLNKIIQEKLFLKGKPIIVTKTKKWFIGDKVINNINHYEKNIFNGDIYFIKDFKKNDVILEKDNEVIKISQTLLNKNFDLAYAITVHKSQGSEVDCVISPYVNATKFISRNLLYTAITRAKKELILFANRQTLYKISTNKQKARETHLKTFINK